MSFWKKKIEELGIPSEPDSMPTSSTSQVKPSSNVESSPKVTVPTEKVTTPPITSSRSSDKPEDVLAERFGKTRSALGEGTVIQGKLSFDTPVRIDGKLSGEIFSSKVLIIGPTGQIDATIEVASLIVLGSVRGKVNVQERVELWKGAQFEGSLKTPCIVVEDGSIFSGTCEMLASLERTQAAAKGAGTSTSLSASTGQQGARSESGIKENVTGDAKARVAVDPQRPGASPTQHK